MTEKFAELRVVDHRARELPNGKYDEKLSKGSAGKYKGFMWRIHGGDFESGKTDSEQYFINFDSGTVEIAIYVPAGKLEMMRPFIDYVLDSLRIDKV
jgi:hypothetical protein